LRPSLLFVHGAFHDARCWQHHFIPWFVSRGWDARTISLRGRDSDYSDPRTPQPGLAHYLEDIQEAVATIAGPTVLIGHSMGGVLAQMALTSPRVAGAVLLCSSPLRPSLSVVARMFASAPISFVRVLAMKDETHAKHLFSTFFYRENLPISLKERYLAELTSESPRARDEVFKRAPPLRPSPSRPILVVAGRDDWSIPMRDHRSLADTFGATLVECDGAHVIMLDVAWESAASAIHAWLKRGFVGQEDSRRSSPDRVAAGELTLAKDKS
jgi:pimeloyl-ACP methyl ester carboxylesterase